MIGKTVKVNAALSKAGKANRAVIVTHFEEIQNEYFLLIDPLKTCGEYLWLVPPTLAIRVVPAIVLDV